MQTISTILGIAATADLRKALSSAGGVTTVNALQWMKTSGNWFTAYGTIRCLTAILHRAFGSRTPPRAPSMIR